MKRRKPTGHRTTWITFILAAITLYMVVWAMFAGYDREWKYNQTQEAQNVR
jgi:nitrate reductase NapE component